MKPIPCKLVLNTSYGYCFVPMEFESINSAVEYARHAAPGYAWRLFDMDGNSIRRGFCDNTPKNGYRGI